MRDLSNRRATVNILKSAIGLGILNLPYATLQVGWLPSIIGMLAICVMTVQGIFFAVMAKDKYDNAGYDAFTACDDRESAGFVSGKGEKTPLMPECSPATATHCGLGCFDEVVREILGRPGQFLWVFSVAFCQYGTAIAYITVIASSIESFMPSTKSTDGSGVGPHRVAVLVGIFVLLSVLSAVKRLRGVALLSLIGLVVYLFVYAAVIHESAVKIHEGAFGATAHMFESKEMGFVTFFGIVSFAFGALPVTIATYDDMNKPDDFYKVVGWSFFICWAIYTSFAVVSYFCFGQNTAEIVLFNFAEGSIFRSGSIATIAVILTLTYVVQMVPVFNCFQTFVGEAVHWFALRILTVASTVVFAWLIPKTVVLVTVCGAFSAACSGFILPPLVYVMMEPPPPPKEYAMAISLISLGCLAGLKVVIL